MSDLLWAKYHDLHARLAAMEAFFNRRAPGWNTIPDDEAPPPAVELKPWEKPTVHADGAVTPPPPIGTHPDDTRGDEPPNEPPNYTRGDEPPPEVIEGTAVVDSDSPMAPMTVTDGDPVEPVDA